MPSLQQDSTLATSDFNWTVFSHLLCQACSRGYSWMFNGHFSLFICKFSFSCTYFLFKLKHLKRTFISFFFLSINSKLYQLILLFLCLKCLFFNHIYQIFIIIILFMHGYVKLIYFEMIKFFTKFCQRTHSQFK